MDTQIRFRLKVHGHYSFAVDQYVWEYIINDLANSRIVAHGFRFSWSEALNDGMAYMRGQYD